MVKVQGLPGTGTAMRSGSEGLAKMGSGAAAVPISVNAVPAPYPEKSRLFDGRYIITLVIM
jgi:hypothetical protein